MSVIAWPAVVRDAHSAAARSAAEPCRYDVKYGSAGFNSYGYQAGCEFATRGTSFAQALAIPSAAQYLCPAATPELSCHHDFSGSGSCTAEFTSESFLTLMEVPPRSHPAAHFT